MQITLKTGGDTTYKIALAYYPNPDIQIRLSYNKAMRAPAINELFSYSQRVIAGIQDPCTVGLSRPVTIPDIVNGGEKILERDETLAETCISTGVPQENLYDFTFKELDPAVDRGGNPDLLAEDARTYSVGFVWTPYAFSGLSVSLDYFDVSIENYIEATPVTPTQLMVACYDQEGGIGGPGSTACNSIGRDSEGRLTSLFLGFQNLGLHEVNGWDLNLEFGFELFAGSLDINYFATKSIKAQSKMTHMAKSIIDAWGSSTETVTI